MDINKFGLWCPCKMCFISWRAIPSTEPFSNLEMPINVCSFTFRWKTVPRKQKCAAKSQAIVGYLASADESSNKLAN